MSEFIKNPASENGQLQIAKAILSLNGGEGPDEIVRKEFNDNKPTEYGQRAIANAIRYLGGQSVTVSTKNKEFVDNPASINGQKEIVDAILSVQGSIGGGGEPTLEDKTVKSTTETQTVTCGSDYDGIGTVTVSPIVLETVTVKSTTESQTVEPTSGKDGISSITVSPLDLETKTVKSTDTEQTITKGSGYDAIGTVTVSPISLQNKTISASSSQQTITADSAQNYDGLGTITLNAIDLENKTVKSTTSSQTISSASHDGIGTVTVTPWVLETVNVTPSSSVQTITAGSGYDAIGQVNVAAATGGGGDAGEIMFGNGNKSVTATSSITSKDCNGFSQVTSFSLPNAESIGIRAFKGLYASGSFTVTAPKVDSILASAFEDSKLSSISIGTAGEESGRFAQISSNAFYNCSSFTDIYIYWDDYVIPLNNTSAFSGITSYTIHVPANLLSEYQSETNWSSLSLATWAAIT